MMFSRTIAAALAATLLSAGGTLAASFVPCNDAAYAVDVSADVSATQNCHVIESLGAGTTTPSNMEGFLSRDDWEKAGRWTKNDAAGTYGSLTIGGTEPKRQGTWSVLSSVLSDYGSAVLVFRKAGKNPAFVAYEITDDAGTYASPFFKSNGVDRIGLSRITLYVSSEPDVVGAIGAVPLPAGGVLLLSGLLGLGLLRRRS